MLLSALLLSISVESLDRVETFFFPSCPSIVLFKEEDAISRLVRRVLLPLLKFDPVFPGLEDNDDEEIILLDGDLTTAKINFEGHTFKN